jgi:hypothetical protein
MTFLPRRAPHGLWGTSNWRFHVGGLKRHVGLVRPRLAENLEVNL